MSAMVTINRGGRGRKSETPTYISRTAAYDAQREMTDIERKIDGSNRLREAIRLYHERNARRWGVSFGVAVNLCEAMQRKSLDGYGPAYPEMIRRRS